MTRVELGSTDGLEVRLQQPLTQSRHWAYNRKQDKLMHWAVEFEMDCTCVQTHYRLCEALFHLQAIIQTPLASTTVSGSE